MEPLKILEVIADEVGTPRNDGTRGSALYKVPLRLNRKPDAFEQQLLASTWDRPPLFTTKHRPGILRMVNDKLILDGTTIDEVEEVHVSTLKSVLEVVNRDAEQHRKRKQDEEQARLLAEKEHEDHISEVSERIQFD
ncbi:MAG: hypothetical protein F4153_10360 [Acidimicrobiia bacterium]|nr:hypothetical protein [Acidimicrobiia bacterium]